MALSDLLRHLPVERWRNPPPVVAVLRLDGVIGTRGRRSLSLRRFAGAIDRAFALRDLRAVALLINSPGGSPVQSSFLYRRIRQLAEEKGVPVLAFAEDVAASGGYWLALAGDEIYADETSILGSIGVVSGGFGFAQVLQRLGVERRLYTAGEEKSLLDPFLPEAPRGVERMGRLLADLHESFKALVRSRRGAKLVGDEAMLMSGEVFTGRQALERGLVDGLGEMREVLRQRFGARVRLRVVPPERRSLSWSMLGLPRRPDVGDLAADLLARLEERLVWARFGL
jgi:signal peptide peptidase SppA